MFCVKCGKNNADGAVKCRYCGAEMEPNSDTNGFRDIFGGGEIKNEKNSAAGKSTEAALNRLSNKCDKLMKICRISAIAAVGAVLLSAFAVVSVFNCEKNISNDINAHSRNLSARIEKLEKEIESCRKEIKSIKGSEKTKSKSEKSEKISDEKDEKDDSDIKTDSSVVNKTSEGIKSGE